MTISSRKRLLNSLLGLPNWVKLWLLILMATNMASLWFLDSEIGRWIALVFLAVGLLNLPTAYFQNGLTRLLSFPHFLWIGLLIYLAPQIWGAEALSAGVLRNYAMIVFFINAISLAFDALESARWLRGEREILGLEKYQKVKNTNG